MLNDGPVTPETQQTPAFLAYSRAGTQPKSDKSAVTHTAALARERGRPDMVATARTLC